MRDVWQSRWGFILAAAGSAIGLGNLWRFPFQAYKNGGGAFLLPYFVALLTAAIPLMIMELAYGRSVRGGSVGAFSRLGPRLEYVGWAQVMIPMLIMTYYAAIMAVALIFMVYSLAHAFGVLHWIGDPGTLMEMVTGSAAHGLDWRAGLSVYILVAVVFVWAVTWFVVRRGVAAGIEKLCNVFMPVLIILIVAFMVNSLRLEGALVGLRELFAPDFSKILDPGIWVSAYGQVFFSASLATGIMIAYGSYLDDRADVVGSAVTTVLINSAFDLMAGVLVFSTLGYLVGRMDVEFTSFGSGAGVAFLAFPTAIATISDHTVVQGLLGFLFFFSLFIAGLTSGISMLEAFTAAALDKFRMPRERLVSIVAGVGLLGSGVFATYAGFNYLLDIVDGYVGNVVLAGIALVEVVLISYVYGAERLRAEANEHSTLRVGRSWDVLLKYVTPALLGAVVVTNLANVFGDLFSTDTIAVVANIAFGWGAVLIMILGARWLYRRPWTAGDPAPPSRSASR